MNTETLSVVVAVIVGTGSLFGLLALLRQQFPNFFVPSTKKLTKVIKTQSALGEMLAYEGSSHPSENLLNSIKQSSISKKRDARLTIEKRLRYARWKISPSIFHLFELAISGLVFSIVAMKFNIVIQILGLLSGPMVMRVLLSFAVDRRSKRFDADYAHFLMSMVGLLKTGMTAMGALESASRGLEPGSLVREEVEVMVERVRVGVLEDKSIGAFGEDIHHPEIELFIQALLLSRRVGGNLSDTLERLSKQVRKRQYFKSSAVAAVSMQRASLFVIIGILVSLELYMGILYPALVFKGMETEAGWHIWQVCFGLIALAIFWARQVTRIKV